MARELKRNGNICINFCLFLFSFCLMCLDLSMMRRLVPVRPPFPSLPQTKAPYLLLRLMSCHLIRCDLMDSIKLSTTTSIQASSASKSKRQRGLIWRWRRCCVHPSKCVGMGCGRTGVWLCVSMCVWACA